ncbi:MAG: hypothetical protein QXI58_00480 [Candidatus Micrarchaeia archaeon]
MIQNPSNPQRINSLCIPARITSASIQVFFGDICKGTISSNGLYVTVEESLIKTYSNRTYTTNMWQNYYIQLADSERYYKIVANTETQLTLESPAHINDRGFKSFNITPLCDEALVRVLPKIIANVDPIRHDWEYHPVSLYQTSIPVPIITVRNLQIGVEYVLELITFYKRKKGGYKRIEFVCGQDWNSCYEATQDPIVIANTTPNILKIFSPKTQRTPAPQLPLKSPQFYEIEIKKTIDNNIITKSWQVKAPSSYPFTTPIDWQPPYELKLKAIYFDLYMLDPDDLNQIKIYTINVS